MQGGGDPTGGKFALEDALKGLSGKGSLLATFETNMGTITCELYEKQSPKTVANFVGLARGKRPWKDPKTIHSCRFITDFACATSVAAGRSI